MAECKENLVAKTNNKPFEPDWIICSDQKSNNSRRNFFSTPKNAIRKKYLSLKSTSSLVVVRSSLPSFLSLFRTHERMRRRYGSYAKGMLMINQKIMQIENKRAAVHLQNVKMSNQAKFSRTLSKKCWKSKKFPFNRCNFVDRNRRSSKSNLSSFGD